MRMDMQMSITQAAEHTDSSMYCYKMYLCEYSESLTAVQLVSAGHTTVWSLDFE
jgi:hypothetical protein